MKERSRLELVCPAGTPAALRTAIDAGADVVYCGYRDETNARNFPGLNFTRSEMEKSIAYAHGHETKVFVAINTFPRAGREQIWHSAVDDSVTLGADALILADLGLLAYATDRHPLVRRHLSVQAAAANADTINFYAREFGVRRVVLPRVLTIDEIAAINREIDCETEAFVFGSLCVMAEGRCSLSSYVTGASPNLNGVCSPGSQVAYRECDGKLVSELGGFAIHKVDRSEPAPYPTICKGYFSAGDFHGHVFEEPAGLDGSALIPQLAMAGVTALKIEGRQRSRAYVGAAVRNLRRAIDNYAAGLPVGESALLHLSEGQSTTQGAYQKAWR
ncbi:MAG: U32 family peptidase [Alphaproteobacteria bacterium]|nr:U32 family peptidase [Alphaproteobacteria bacterium]